MTWGDNGDVLPIQRGQKVYDTAAKAYTFTQDIVADKLVIKLAWDYLPPLAQRYVSIRSARKYAQRLLGGEPVVGYTQQDEMQAWTDLMRDELNTLNINLLTSQPARDILMR